ncbi:MAG: hypothetical protein ACREPI_12300 [Candidatus Dormibacterales bacterium]
MASAEALDDGLERSDRLLVAQDVDRPPPPTTAIGRTSHWEMPVREYE